MNATDRHQGALLLINAPPFATAVPLHQHVREGGRETLGGEGEGFIPPASDFTCMQRRGAGRGDWDPGPPSLAFSLCNRRAPPASFGGRRVPRHPQADGLEAEYVDVFRPRRPGPPWDKDGGKQWKRPIQTDPEIPTYFTLRIFFGRP